MNRSDLGLRSFVQELRRRRVVRVTVVYAAVGWLLIEVADTVVPPLGLPGWVVTLVIILVALGLPLALVLAWAFDVTPDGVRRTTAAGTEAEVGEPSPGRLAPVVVTLIALVALTAAVVVAVRASRAPGNTPPSASVAVPHAAALAVFPFSVRGDAEVRELGEGMASLLGTKLDGAGDLRTIDSRVLLSALEREHGMSPAPEEARAIAIRFGAGHYVRGDILQAGDRLQLSARVYPVDGGLEPPTASVEGEADELFALVDALAAQLLAGMAGGPAARVRRIAAVTTSSLPALRAFLAGERLARGAQFASAVQEFERAVAEDSTFALAWYRLALAAEWNFQDDLARSAAERLAPWADRLAERDRRMLEAFLVRRRGANENAERLYRSILGTYPDDFEAWVDLAEVLFHARPLQGGSFTASREALERVLVLDPTHSTSLIHLARVAAFEERLAELDSLAAKFLDLNPEADRTVEMRALRAFAHGQPDEIAAILQEIRGAEDASVALAVWNVAVFVRDLGGALQLARVLAGPTRSDEARTVAHAWAAHLLLAHGRLDEAHGELDALARWNPGAAAQYRALLAVLPFLPRDTARESRALGALERLDPAAIPTSRNPNMIFTAHDALNPIVRDYLMGLLNARLGRTAEAMAAAERVESHQLPTTAGSLARDLGRSIRAQVARLEGRPADALALLESSRMETWYGQTLASPFYAQVLERFTRAELLLELGRDEEALLWYRHLAELSPFETPYLPVALIRQAEIHERAGRTDLARADRQAARKLWAACDPQLCQLLEP